MILKYFFDIISTPSSFEIFFSLFCIKTIGIGFVIYQLYFLVSCEAVRFIVSLVFLKSSFQVIRITIV